MIERLEEIVMIMTRCSATVSMLANIERRLVDTADFVRANASRLSETDPLREQLEEILESLDDAVDGVRGTKEVFPPDTADRAGHRLPIARA